MLIRRSPTLPVPYAAGVGVRAAGAIGVLAGFALLTGCTPVVGDATEDLKDELLGFDIVEYGYASTGEDTLFDDPFSSIQLDVAEDSTAEQLDELITYWRFGVDGIDARWSFGMTKDGGAAYDDFNVVGERSVADLGEMVRFWHSLGPATDSADVRLDDYADDRDGSVQLELGPQRSAGVQGFMLALQQNALELPGAFSWSVDADIPAGELSIAGDNVLPDQHMLDLLEIIAAPPTTGDVGAIWFWAIESDDPFIDGNPMRLNVGVYLEPPSIDDLGADTPEAWTDLGERVHDDPDVWPVIQEIASRLPHDETVVTLDIHVYGDQLAKLDPLDCPSERAEEIFGPLNSDVWDSWGGGDCEAPRSGR
jgi:hypothetical protein